MHSMYCISLCCRVVLWSK